MKAGSVLLLSLALATVTGAARAQASPAAPAAQAPSAKPKELEGVTVTGRRPPTKSCSSRDDACIAAVVAELKARYPQELQKWCAHVEERAAMNTIMFMEINLDRPHPNVAPYMPPAVSKVACAREKTP
jgi:hypothetical protein